MSIHKHRLVTEARSFTEDGISYNVCRVELSSSAKEYARMHGYECRLGDTLPYPGLVGERPEPMQVNTKQLNIIV